MTAQAVNEKLFIKLSAEDVERLISKLLFGENGCSPDCEIRCAAAEAVIPLISNAKHD